MRQLKVFLFLLCIGLSITLISCKGEVNKKEEKKEVKGKEYTSKYICPMYCKGSGDSKMGICPVCEMDYELNEKYSEEQ